MRDRRARGLLAEEVRRRADGSVPSCYSTPSFGACQRARGHVGCHFASLDWGEARWVDLGRRMCALYPEPDAM